MSNKEQKHKCKYCDSTETTPYTLENVATKDKWTLWLCKDHKKAVI